MNIAHMVAEPGFDILWIDSLPYLIQGACLTDPGKVINILVPWTLAFHQSHFELLV